MRTRKFIVYPSSEGGPLRGGQITVAKKESSVRVGCVKSQYVVGEISFGGDTNAKAGMGALQSSQWWWCVTKAGPSSWTQLGCMSCAHK